MHDVIALIYMNMNSRSRDSFKPHTQRGDGGSSIADLEGWNVLSFYACFLNICYYFDTIEWWRELDLIIQIASWWHNDFNFAVASYVKIVQIKRNSDVSATGLIMYNPVKE